MDQKLLADLGLNTGEAKIYSAVVKSGEVAPAPLAKAAGTKRTTAYAIAHSLVEKGLLIENATKRPRTFSLTPPSEIKNIITQERRRFGEREKLLERFASELSRTQSEKTYPVPKIRFVEENKVEQFQLVEIPKWQKSVATRDKTWWGFQDHAWVEKYGHLIREYWKDVPSDVSLKFLSNQEDLSTELKLKNKFPRRTIKYWNKATNFLSSLWIAGDYVVIVNTRRKPHYLVEIHDETLANDLREVFKNLWPLV